MDLVIYTFKILLQQHYIKVQSKKFFKIIITYKNPLTINQMYQKLYTYMHILEIYALNNNKKKKEKKNLTL